MTTPKHPKDKRFRRTGGSGGKQDVPAWLLPQGKRNLVGDAIRKHRMAAGLTQEEVQEALYDMGYDLDQTLIGRIESGKRSVWDYEIVLFSKLFKVPVEKFFR